MDTSQEDGDEDPLLWADARSWASSKETKGKAFHLSLDPNIIIREPIVDAFLDTLPEDRLLGQNKPFDSLVFGIQARATIPEVEKLRPYLGWWPLEVVRQTLEKISQLAQSSFWSPMHEHTKPWFLGPTDLAYMRPL